MWLPKQSIKKIFCSKFMNISEKYTVCSKNRKTFNEKKCALLYPKENQCLFLAAGRSVRIFFQKTLILAFEADSALSRQIVHFLGEK